MKSRPGACRLANSLAVALLLTVPAGRVAAQAPAAAPAPAVTRIDLSVGRSYPITTTGPITRVSIANPEVADVIVIAEREVVINAKAAGETDAIIWQGFGARQQYRVSVRSASDRPQIAVAVKIAEVRRDRLRQFGVSYFGNGANARPGTGVYRNGQNYAEYPARDLRAGFDSITVQTGQLFTNLLTNFGSKELQAFIEAEQQRGDARLLAEPTILAANREDATFLAGGELPIPIAQPGNAGAAAVTVTFREFGIRLLFNGEIISDSLIKLRVRPEVSSLDYSNAITLQGFRIPAFRTRRVETTLDVRRDQSIIISGLFNEERERVRSGIPLLMDIPILGALFSSTRWQRNETELIAIVTPAVFDPMTPRGRDVLRVRPDSLLPAQGALEPRLDSIQPAGSRARPPQAQPGRRRAPR